MEAVESNDAAGARVLPDIARIGVERTLKRTGANRADQLKRADDGGPYLCYGGVGKRVCCTVGASRALMPTLTNARTRHTDANDGRTDY